ncbi:MAG: SpoIIE family protein phosphatase [Clostridia bacterium]|nr:SpoIIE family protein phosphatase [Clostridia bacterium]
MNDLCADIGYKSINHYGEQLCGDHVDVIEQSNENATVIVLADGLGSGVKASILSTLTSKIISTMMAEGMPLEECVSTIAATLPVCSVRGVAYSTFTIIQIKNNQIAEIIQYDNPKVIVIRDDKNYDYPTTEMNIGGKKILKSIIPLQENDVFVAMSDGCPHAGIGTAYNFGWKRSEIIDFVEMLVPVGYTAKTLSTMLVDECNRLYDNKPGDDATACIVRIRKREPMNILFGPPSNRDDCDRMMSLFFSKEGKHIICGGTTSSIAAKYLRKPLKASLKFEKSDIPPIAELEGVDLVTEGVITVNRVLEYAKDHLAENTKYDIWSQHRDGASLISRLLFEEATDINFYVGRAVNPAHQNPDLPITFNIKMNLVEELSECLKRMGKRIKVSYF